MNFLTYKFSFQFLFCLVVGSTIGMDCMYGQENVYFDRITTNDGLSQSDINSVYQDSQGFMWFATHDGLNKYDGYSFTTYKPVANHPHSISSNLVFAITGDNDGNLWIGTTGGGLNYLDRSTEKFTRYHHREDDDHSLSNDHITTVYLDKKKRLWVGTNKGLDMLDTKKLPDTVVFQHFTPKAPSFLTSNSDNSVYCVYEGSKGELWVGGNRGLSKLAHDAEGNLYLRRANEAIGLPNVAVRSLAEDKFGRLVIATSSGLFCQENNEPDQDNIHKIQDGSFQVVTIDDYNQIWCGTNKGLLNFKNQDKYALPRLTQRFTDDDLNANSLSKNIVKSLFIDRTGILWIGTNGGGVNKYDPERKRFRHIRKTLDPHSLSYDKIRSMLEDSNGTLWIGTEGGGLNMLTKKDDDGQYDNFQYFDAISKAFALAEVQMKGKKTLLIGAENAPSLFTMDIDYPNDIKNSDIRPVPEMDHSVFALLEDREKTLWIGTYNDGVHRWTPHSKDGGYKKDIFTYRPNNKNGLSSNIIRNIYQDRTGNIWFGTGNGLCKLSSEEADKEHPKFEVYKNVPGDTTSLSHDYILAIHESRAGDLWIGTFGGGLDKFKPSSTGRKGKFKSYSEIDGLPNNVIKGILEDDKGNLWLSTNLGLSKFDPQKETFKNYDVHDGLQDNEFQELACLKRKDGEMLFGGINGFNAFYPDEIKDNTFGAETVITQFSIFNKPVGIGEMVHGRPILKTSIEQTKEIRLEYLQNSFSFQFASLHYASPQKNRYAYILEGFDKDWTYTNADKRFATYTNIEPGDYILKVKGSNNDGMWDTTPTVLKINVTPPFWRTKLAYAFYCLLILGLLLGLWKFTIIRTTKKHQLELEHLEKETQEEVQRMKLEFFTNISHEFRTPLTLIKGPLKYLQKKGDKLDRETVKQQYNLMQKNTDYLLRLVNQLLDFRKIDQGKMRLVVRQSNIVEFIKEVGEPFQFMANKKMIGFTIESTRNDIISWFDHDALEKIMNNLLSNAFKFTPKGGIITIKISDDQERENKSLQENTDTIKNVIIEVIDSGPGIPDPKKPVIFERFYMEKNDKIKNPEGMGIGLSFVKSLAALHQGNIEVISDEGKGTKFVLRLPMDRASYENIPEISCKEVFDADFLARSSETESFAIGINDEIEDLNLSKSRSKLPILLVVDDNADIRSFIKLALGDTYTVYEAENGIQGLEMANKIIPNIIISDVLMPVMDGIELCKNLKINQETSHIPVLMLTAKTSQESELEGFRTGADDYIRKPFDMELLQLKLSNILKRRNELRKRFNRSINPKASEVTVTSADEKFMQEAIAIVEKHMMNTDFNVEMMVKEMGLSRSNLYLKFKEITGLTSSEFIRNIRLKRAVQLFEKSDLSVKEIMYMTGFNTASYFAKCFKNQFGMTPSDYLRKIQDRDFKDDSQ